MSSTPVKGSARPPPETTGTTGAAFAQAIPLQPAPGVENTPGVESGIQSTVQGSNPGTTVSESITPGVDVTGSVVVAASDVVAASVVVAASEVVAASVVVAAADVVAASVSLLRSRSWQLA